MAVVVGAVSVVRPMVACVGPVAASVGLESVAPADAPVNTTAVPMIQSSVLVALMAVEDAAPLRWKMSIHA